MSLLLELRGHWEPSFRGAEHGRTIIYVGRSHWPFALRRAKWASHEADGCRAFVRQLFGSRLFLPDVVGWANLFNSLRQYTAKITAFSRHFVSRTFENIELNSRTIEGTWTEKTNSRTFEGFEGSVRTLLERCGWITSKTGHSRR